MKLHRTTPTLWALALAALLTGCASTGSTSTSDRLDNLVEQTWPIGIIGQSEQIVVWPGPQVMNARIDTGATTSSIDARDIKPFERDGESWVRFNLVDRETEEATEVERAVVRIASIKQHAGKDDLERPVVMMTIKIGKTKLEREFSLADRSSFDFPLLIGRNVLSGQAIVDVGRADSVTVETNDE